MRAEDNGLESGWSTTQSVEVTQIVEAEPGHYTGLFPPVSFDVTNDQQVCNFSITVPFGARACQIRPSSCSDISDNAFGFGSFELGAVYLIVGTFDTPTHVSGNFSVTMCEGSVITPPSSGTWEASK